MKKIILIAIVLIAFFLVPFGIWQLTEVKTTNVVILDKTVPTSSKREHNGLVWLLNHFRYLKEDNQIYNTSEDYYGFVPNEKDEDYLIRSLPDQLDDDTDVIYMADTYGVYQNDLSWSETTTRGEHSDLIYGGLEQEEWQTIKNHVISKPTTLIAEFNTFASPTSPLVRDDVTDFLNINWTGWTGRYFESLDRENQEIPVWMIERYEAKAKQDWSFEDGGFILIDDLSEDIIVLSEKLGHIDSDGIHLRFTEKGQEITGQTESPSYSYWFDIITPNDEEDVLAYYDWDVTETGSALLNEAELPVQFAAVLHHQKQESNLFYFAGDFVDIEGVPALTNYAGVAKWKEWFSFEVFNDTASFFWKTYVPMMNQILALPKPEQNNQDNRIFPKIDDVSYASRVQNSSFEVFKDNEWVPLTIKGVNLGMGKPGYFPGEAAITEQEYERWFEQIGEMNANTIRVYTLHPPEFYRALKNYNDNHENPIYLFHGIWIDEEALEETLDAFTPEIVETFQAETKKIVDAVHGNATVEQQPGHAYGQYHSDVSSYMLGWISGIEWYPFMVDNMTKVYPDLGDYTGTYISTNNAKPMEHWLAWQLDELMIYEKETYNWLSPVSFTNWVTTDLLDQPAEPSDSEDLASIDPNVLSLQDTASNVGMFASYHVYPYYPDFLNIDEKYTEYIDHRGEKNNYAGYLDELQEAHSLPVLIAEFGLPASRGLTHVNPFGWNQGFLTEKEQGTYLVNLFEDILHEDMLGGLIFTWQDEWFKKTWNTMDYDNDERRPFWSNAQTNEQQFGIMSFDRLKIKVDGNQDDWTEQEPFYEDDSQLIQRIFVDHDERYLYTRVDFNETYNKERFESEMTNVLFDVKQGQGNEIIDSLSNLTIDTGIDFKLEIQGSQNAQLLVDSYYDTFFYDYGIERNMLETENLQPSINSGIFNPIRLALSSELIRPDTQEVIPFTYYETGAFRFGNANPSANNYDSLADYFYDEDSNTLEIRIPWMLLNFKDPSQREIVGNIQKNGIDSSETIEGISIAVVHQQNDKLVSSFPSNGESSLITGLKMYTWETWNEPLFEERLKQSYEIIKDKFSEVR